MSYQRPEDDSSDQTQPLPGPIPERPAQPPLSATQTIPTQKAQDSNTPEQNEQAPRQRRFGMGTLIACTLVAGLIGGGSAAGISAAITAQNSNQVEQQSSSGTGTGIEVNRSEDATVVTQAAAKASPSVVTLSVSSGQSAGSGSGVILNEEGHILTNTHVVTLGGAVADPSISVQTSDGNVYSAEIVGTDPQSDLAVVKINADDLQPIEMGSSSDLNVGDQTIAIGAPLGLSGTVTDGIVSQLDRTISVASSAVPDSQESEGEGGQGGGSEFEFRVPGLQQQSSQGSIYINVIQSDAAINPGNSGGALLDNQGRLIGINVAIASAGSSGTSDSSGNIGVGFAIPVDYAQRIADEIIANGEATHAMLGVQVTPEPAQAQGGEEAESVSGQMTGASSFSAGARVQNVVEGSPAEEAGIQEGDLITGVDGRAVGDASALTATIREYPAGGTAILTVNREDEEEEIEVTLGDGADQS